MASIRKLQINANDNEPVAFKVRLEPIVNIRDGTWDGVGTIFNNDYEDWCSNRCQDHALPADVWLGLAVERAGQAYCGSGFNERPICVTAPYMVLINKNAPAMARRGARRSGMEPEEFRLEFSDASILLAGNSAREQLASFASAGFRLGLDARTGWRIKPQHSLLQQMDAARLDAHNLDLIEPEKKQLCIFAEQERSIYAENSLWPGSRSLLEWGVSGVLASYRPRWRRHNAMDQRFSGLAPPPA